MGVSTDHNKVKYLHFPPHFRVGYYLNLDKLEEQYYKGGLKA